MTHRYFSIIYITQHSLQGWSTQIVTFQATLSGIVKRLALQINASRLFVHLVIGRTILVTCYCLFPPFECAAWSRQHHSCKCAMSSIDIIFVTSIYFKFKWLDSLKTFKKKQIEEFIMIFRGALSVFFAKLTDRRKFWKNQSFENYKKMFQKTVQQINEQKLITIHEKYLNNLNSFLTQTDRAQIEQKKNKTNNVTKQYFWFISKITNWFYVFLIFCALNKHKIEHFDENQRVKFVKYIVQNKKTFFCRNFQNKIIQFNVSKKCINVHWYHHVY